MKRGKTVLDKTKFLEQLSNDPEVVAEKKAAVSDALARAVPAKAHIYDALRIQEPEPGPIRWFLVLDTDLVVASVESAAGVVSARARVSVQSLSGSEPCLVLRYNDSSLVEAEMTGLGPVPLKSGERVTADAVARFAAAIFEVRARAQ